MQHEWTHYIQKDVWVKLLVKLLCIIYWWNPVLYLLKYTIDYVMEVKSDLHVTKNLSENEKLEYLETILHVVKNRTERKSVTAPTGMALVSDKKESFLKRRFRFVLDYKKLGYLNRISSVGLSLLIVICFIASYFVVIQPYSGPPAEQESESYYSIEKDNSYLVEKESGGYSLYVDNTYMCDVTDINVCPFSELDIMRREKNEKK